MSEEIPSVCVEFEFPRFSLWERIKLLFGCKLEAQVTLTIERLSVAALPEDMREDCSASFYTGITCSVRVDEGLASRGTAGAARTAERQGSGIKTLLVAAKPTAPEATSTDGACANLGDCSGCNIGCDP